MEYGRKKNTDNFRQERDYVLDEYNEDHLTIGRYQIYNKPQYYSSIHSRRAEEDTKPYNHINAFQHEIDDDDNDDDRYTSEAINYDEDSSQESNTSHIDYNFTNNNQIYSYKEIEYLFEFYKIRHVNMHYYPFANKHVQDMYNLYFFDPYNINIHTCPACFNKYEQVIVVIDNQVMLCPTCYKQESIIKYI